MALAKANKAYQQAAHYCSYQERTEQEVRAKLQALGIAQQEADQVIQALKAENFLNEERYVAAFIRGRFLGKHWGKRKLFVALTKRGVAPALIQKGLASIKEADYLQTLREVATQKKQYLVGADLQQDQQQLMRYLLQKGYEPELVSKTLQELLEA